MNETTNNEPKEKNNLKHLCFEEYFERDWDKHFQKQETVQNIFEATGLSDTHEFVQINSRYVIDDNRAGVIALIKRKNSKLLEKLIIDVIADNSSFDQVIDVVYSIGSDCDYRMILCDWNSKKRTRGLRMTDNIMTRLVEYLNGHLFLYWISAAALRDVDGTMKIIYTVIESATKDHSSSGIPDRRNIEYAELFCYAMASSIYYDFLHEDPINFDSYWEVDDAETEWTDEGLITKIDIHQDDYEWLFTMRRENIINDDCSYEYNGILTITEDIPFQNFKNSLPEAKDDLANNYYCRSRTASRIDELLMEKEDEDEEDSENSDSQLLEDREDI